MSPEIETDRKVILRLCLIGVGVTATALVLAVSLTWLSTGHLAPGEQRRALTTAMYASLIITPLCLAFTSHQSWRNHQILKQVDMLACTDELTGLANRRAFWQRTHARIEAGDPASQPCAMLLLDLDHFKRVNDLHGHQVGDETLVHVAGCIRSTAPRDSIVARLGGEEFAVLAPLGDGVTIERLARAMCRSVANSPFRTAGCEVRTTISLGVTRVIPGETVSSALSRADAALYEAKDAGRNRYLVAA